VRTQSQFVEFCDFCCFPFNTLPIARERKRKLEVQIIEETSELEQLTITFEQSQLRASSAVAEAQVTVRFAAV
jgi:hypothetical protein